MAVEVAHGARMVSRAPPLWKKIKKLSQRKEGRKLSGAGPRCLFTTLASQACLFIVLKWLLSSTLSITLNNPQPQPGLPAAPAAQAGAQILMWSLTLDPIRSRSCAATPIACSCRLAPYPHRRGRKQKYNGKVNDGKVNWQDFRNDVISMDDCWTYLLRA